MDTINPKKNSDEMPPTPSLDPSPQQDGPPVPMREDRQSVSPESIKATYDLRSHKHEPRKVRRKDSGKPHRVRHGILSREVLNALIQSGEDQKTLRRLERQFRAALQANGPFGDLFFDRFWAAYLRLLLISHFETRLIIGDSASKSKPKLMALTPGPRPTLVQQDPDDQQPQDNFLLQELPQDLLRSLVLVQRYDRHQSRELYRALGLLLIMRRGGELALEDWATEILGNNKSRQEG